MIDFDMAKTWHKMFANQIELVVAGLIDECPALDSVCDDSACKLGTWLYGSGKTLEVLPSYDQLKTHHHQFHQVACDVLRAHLTHSGEEKIGAALAEFGSVSAEVVRLIDCLKADYRERGHGIAFKSQYGAPPQRVIDEWDGSLTVGLPEIDAQHRSILKLANQLLYAPEESLGSELANEALTELGKFLQLHFAIEEANMKQLGMPEAEFAEHHNRHEEMLKQYAEVVIEAYENPQRKVKDIAAFVREWGIDHVVAYDLNIKKYLR